MRSIVRLLFGVVAAAMAFAACGSDAAVQSASDSASSASTAPDEAEAADADTTTEAPVVSTTEDSNEASSPTTTTATESDDDQSPQTDVVDDAGSVVGWDGDNFAASIQPIFESKCANCHSPGGPGAFHWQIDSVQDVVDTHQLIAGVVEAGWMPPWPASKASVPFKYDRSLSDDELEAVLAWSAAGAPIDVDPSTPLVSAEPVLGITDPDLEIVPDAYAGDPSNVDDYRCLIYDPQNDEDVWITGYEFVPDQTAVVHHAIAYLIEGDRRARADERDGADGRPGWQCYGSSGLGGRDGMFLGWAPGQDATQLPEGTGLRVPADDFVVIQIHYHYEGSAPADESSLRLEFVDGDTDLDPIVISPAVAPAEIPCLADESGPLCDRDAALAHALDRFGDEGVQAEFINRLCGVTPADFEAFTNGVAESSCDIPAVLLGAQGEIISVLGHMHEIGDWFRMTLNPDTPDELVLLDIPDWDFDWQYAYEPVDMIVLDADDTIRIECGWDRGRRRADLEPAWILWADGTNDEMCFSTIVTRGSSDG